MRKSTAFFNIITYDQTSMQFIGIIPARFGSTRFPGKPLVEINGISMIRRVYERARSAGILSNVVVATDDKRIFDHVSDFGNAVYTSPEHPSGTDRCYEAAAHQSTKLNIQPDDVIVNIQGDEPFIHHQQIKTICELFSDEKVNIATLMKRIETKDQLFNENIVKVVAGVNGNALYFSRSAIPTLRGIEHDRWLESGTYYKHIGMYAYRYKVLREITKLRPSVLERAESLEQLRWLENGYKIYIKETEWESHAVDTVDDLKYFEDK
jgi:3-deoxy-manno-octulosonate cytidylyltransferase (CMP-KDO synthetase)